MRTRGWLATAAPALLVVVPLAGFSFQGDERRNIYLNAHRFGSNPLEAARQAYDEIGVFIDLGNFRPVGRFFDYVEQSFVFEAAEATGVAPHVTHGLVRLVMVGLLAVLVLQMVETLFRSAGIAPNRHPARWFTPLVLGVTLVAGGPESPITHFPFLFLGSAMVILAVPMLVARDRDMTRRPIGAPELAGVAALGAVAAMTFDLVYIAPPLVAVFIAARGLAAGWEPRVVLASAAVRRFAALCGGFLVVFVPTRIEIARRCGDGGCYSGSDIDLTGDVAGLTAGRVVSGAPPAGWRHDADLAADSGLSFGLRDLLGNSLLALVVVLLIAVVVRAGMRADQSESGAVAWPRLAAALGLLGAAIAVLAALLVSLSGLIQRERPAVGEGWRDTVLVQVGWAFMLLAVLVVVVGFLETAGFRRVAIAGVAAVVGAGLLMSLLSNERLARTDRRDPLSSLTSQISVATVDFDLADFGNEHRCALIEAYTVQLPDPEAWIGGPQLRHQLDKLMLARHGRAFCDPAVLASDDA